MAARSDSSIAPSDQPHPLLGVAVRLLYLAFMAATLPGAVAWAQSPPVPSMPQATVAESYGQLPLRFEANHGQTDERVKFLSRTTGYSLFLTGDNAVLALRGANGALRMKFRHPNPAVKITGADALPGTSNYFIGNDPARWQANVPTYAKVKYEGIYSGIDLVYYGNQRQLEYDFIVAPGADPHRIAFEISGPKRIRRDERGDLVLQMDDVEVRWHKPVAYQEKNGARHEIAASYTITNKNRIGFEVAEYDANQPLYIDPLLYSTYLGGNGNDFGYAIALDSAGNAYVTGQTFSTNFPTTAGAFETTCRDKSGASCSSNGEVFITKLNPAGSVPVYSTYLGGTGGDAGAGIAVDSAGNAYVTGQTFSTNFPTTTGAFQTVCKHEDPCNRNGHAFVTKLDPTGSALVYSTYLGGKGTDWGGSIAVDNAGHAYVTGATTSPNFPVTSGAFQTICGDIDVGCALGDAFVTKLNPAGSALVYSTYFGGVAVDYGRGIAVDKTGSAYVIGATSSANLPVTAGAFQPGCGDPGCALDDAFVAKLNPAGSALVYSTHLGGNSYDIGTAITVDGAGNAYATGWTGSTNFPTKNPIQPFNAGGGDAFITKLNAAGSALIYSTYLGGNGQDNGNSIAIDSAGNVYLAGGTSSSNFPAVNALQPANNGYSNAFVARINAAGSALTYSSYLGGSAYDSATAIAVNGVSDAYVTGGASSTNFPTKHPWQAVNGGGYDAFVSMISVGEATTTTLSSSANPSTSGEAVTFTATLASTQGAPPNGETVAFMEGTTLLGTGTLHGGSATFTTSSLPEGANSIKAAYGGDVNFIGSASNTVKQLVNPPAK
ncbi:MAG: SBBP repeat-containing protein [Terriglobales bacterium]